MANGDWDEALRRIEAARASESKELDLHRLEIDTLPAAIADLSGIQWLGLLGTHISDIAPLADLSSLTSLFLDNTRIRDIAPLAGLSTLEHLSLSGTKVADVGPLALLSFLKHLDLRNTLVADISPVAGLPALEYLRLRNTPVADITPFRGHPTLKVLLLDGTQVADISALAGLPGLSVLDLAHSRVSDLRPLLDVPRFIGPKDISVGRSVKFQEIPATRDPGIAAADTIQDNERSLQTLLAHLRTLPPWPQPLPQDVPPPPGNAEALPVPEQDPALPLVWGEEGFDFVAAPMERDPVADACIAELRALLDILVRKGNRHDDLRDRAVKAQDLLQDDPPDALKLHLQYQFLCRLRAGAGARAEAFDDETLSALDSLPDIVPGITLGHPSVQALIARQEANRNASQIGVDPARERIVLERMADADSPFAPAVREVAKAAAEPGAADRLAGTRSVLSRNAAISILRWVRSAAATGVVGAASFEAVKWGVQNGDTLTSLALTISDEAYWWARSALDRMKALLEARAPGP